jgi:hypothetical protein
MTSVTQRIKEIKQPRGGYLSVSSFAEIDLNDSSVLNENENVHSSIVGMVVDYMSRYMMGTEVKQAFKISIMGAALAEQLGRNNSIKEIETYLKRIKDLDDDSIRNACKAVTFDVWFRNPQAALLSKGTEEIEPDFDTINNIRIMIKRSLNFFEKYGPVLVDGFTFEGGGYTETVDSGDGDFLTQDTLWDFKVSKSKPKSDNTLQILMYYIMGKRSRKKEFNKIDKIGIYNPRLNKIYIKKISEISNDIIEEVSDTVIEYNKKGVTRNKEVISLQENKLEMSDVMSILKCSRYKILKMYKENGLPLIKENNKYYIYKNELKYWIIQQEDIRKKRTAVVLITFLITIMFWIIAIMVILSKLK